MNRRRIILASLLILSVALAVIAFQYGMKNAGSQKNQVPSVASRFGVDTDKKIILQDSGEESDNDYRKVTLFDPATWQSELLFEGRFRVLGVFQNHLLVKGMQPAGFFEYDLVLRELVPLNFPSEKHWSEEHYQSVGVNDMFVGKDRLYVTQMTVESADEWNGDAMAFHPYEKFVYSFADNTYAPLKTVEQKFTQVLSKNQNSRAKNHLLRGLSTNGRQALFSEFDGYYGSKNLAWIDLDNKSVQRVIDDGYDYADTGDSTIGAISLNPSGTRMTYRIEREDGPHMELVSTDNVSEPIASVLIPISLITRLNGDENSLGRERISTWIDDERVLVSYESGLALIDFSERIVKELYLDTTMGTNYTEWDFYVFGSDGKRYVAVTDWDNDSNKPCPARPKVMCPEEGSKSILKAVLIDTETKDQRILGENQNFVGWINVPNIYRNELHKFSVARPAGFAVEENSNWYGMHPYDQITFKNAETSQFFEVKVEQEVDGIIPETETFLDTVPSSTTELAGQKAYVYELKNGYCDVGNCSQPMLAIRVYRNGKVYTINFHNTKSLSEKFPESNLSSFHLE